MRNIDAGCEASIEPCDPSSPGMTEEELRLGVAILRAMLAKGAVTIGDAASRAGLAADAVERAVNGWPAVERDRDGRITAFWGLSTHPTPHRLLVPGRDVYVWCAWDALIIPALLGLDVDVESVCPATSARIRLRMTSRGPVDPTPRGTVLSLVDEVRLDAAAPDIFSRFCAHVQFLASPEAANTWIERRGITGRVVTLAEAWSLARQVRDGCLARLGAEAADAPVVSRTSSGRDPTESVGVAAARRSSAGSLSLRASLDTD